MKLTNEHYKSLPEGRSTVYSFDHTLEDDYVIVVDKQGENIRQTVYEKKEVNEITLPEPTVQEIVEELKKQVDGLKSELKQWVDLLNFQKSVDEIEKKYERN